MQINQESLSPTNIKLTINLDLQEMEEFKSIALKKLGQSVKIAGFRQGKAPESLLEKNIETSRLQNELLNVSINDSYFKAIKEKNIKAVNEPEITVTKFVPFTALEYSAKVDIIDIIKLADYKQIKLTPKKVSVSDQEIMEVIKNLAERNAPKKIVKRLAKNGDELTIDFKGVDPRTKTAIAGAEASDFKLILGSKTFIPGFEEELIGLKANQKKSFIIKFPSDYSASELQDKKVNFSVLVKEIKQIDLPKLDDKLAKSFGPFTNLDELKTDVKNQLLTQKQNQADQAFDNEIVNQIVEKTEIAIPDVVIDNEIIVLENEEKKNLVYRGQTWQEHLKADGVSEEEHREKERPIAKQRIKTGIILGEIAYLENITVLPEEVTSYIESLKMQYQDPAMQAELDSQPGRDDIRSRLMVQKTLDYLKNLATAK